MNTNPKAKRILVYGDSFTFGKVPNGSRYSSNERFTGILQETLGKEYEIIEEGLRGRTVSGENAFFPHRNGIEQFGPILGSHLPINLVIIFLGTNDVNSGSKNSPKQIAENLKEYDLKTIWWCEHLGFDNPKILLVTPPKVDEKYSYDSFNDLFRGSEMKSYKLPELYEDIADELNWYFFDSSKIIVPSQIDGIHLDIENNRILGENLAKLINKITN